MTLRFSHSCSTLASVCKVERHKRPNQYRMGQMDSFDLPSNRHLYRKTDTINSGRPYLAMRALTTIFKNTDTNPTNPTARVFVCNGCVGTCDICPRSKLNRQYRLAYGWSSSIVETSVEYYVQKYFTVTRQITYALDSQTL